MKDLIDKLYSMSALSSGEYKILIDNRNAMLSEYLFEKARTVRIENYGYDVYIRGLIEFTNYCKNDCYYCGIRKSNHEAERYRLTKEQILDCCAAGYDLGFRTFVLQGGEDRGFTDDLTVEIISSIKELYPDCAVTLSIGEKSFESYLRYYRAGADRYLLRHETASQEHYRMLHPPNLSSENRRRCLADLKKIGYQTGTGFMVGSPYQTPAIIAEDLLFIKELSPEMIGIGPFIPHRDTPFKDKAAGTMALTIFLIAVLRLMLPDALIPATTALGTIHPGGREQGILAGANVVMPNLSPVTVREKYALYDNKISTGEEAAECRDALEKQMNDIGYQLVTDRGDYKPISKDERGKCDV
jgi:biotin synthase